MKWNGVTRRAIGYYEQALAIHREIGDRRGEAIDSGNCSLMYEQQGNLQRTAGVVQVCVDYECAIGDPEAERYTAIVEEIRRHMTRA
ncbi:MAG TPA: hypothetical protein PLF72_13405 [Anaerolineaceae bacterium]|nr:hypothetical protein [Anaerolineaceae bacterium]HQO98736.1 hypothetical protein [Anaerolineaceae bacterium]